MSSKRSKTANADDLDELFEGLDSTAAVKTKPKKTVVSKTLEDQDILADLENELSSQPPSRPHTPRVKDAPKATKGPATAQSEEKFLSRKSIDAARSPKVEASSNTSAAGTPTSSHASIDAKLSDSLATPETETEIASRSDGGWWGGLLATATATASAAIKQAEVVVKEIQHNEDAKKWADQVRGNVGALKGLSDELRHRALPTFTNIIHTLAPPISSHERLLVHITHDFVGYPNMDSMIYEVFSRVMLQVEGGELMVIQRGSESTNRQGSSAGWRDGPWWKQTDGRRDIGGIKGLVEGTKLCRANAESFAQEYFAANDGLEAARVRATQDQSKTNPVRTSDIFLAIQAITMDTDATLFARTSISGKSQDETSSPGEEESSNSTEELVCFAIILLDPVHEIEYSIVTQTVPVHWIRWLDAAATATIPEDIADILDAGGIDPREWVVEWIEEVLALGVGVVAQRYVARRMGVGERQRVPKATVV